MELHALKTRDHLIVRTSVIGILTNILLASFKAFVGILSNSIAIVLDAVNNVSDAASSLVTIVGTKLAGKEPDRKHPFGYGRIEYISACIIAVIVLYAGVTSFTESVKKIIHPEQPDYSILSLVIVCSAVAVKIVLGTYVKHMGKKADSDSLVNSGKDAMMDAVLSTATVLAALFYIWKGISLEPWLAAVISLFIIKAGIEMLVETLSKVLGERADFDLTRKIKKTVSSFDGVQGAYDLVLNNYGPDAFNGSIHIAVPDTYSAEEIDLLSRRIFEKVYEDHHVLLTAVGVYAVNTKNDRTAEIRDDIAAIAKAHEHVLQVHGFYLDEEKKTIRFDIVISFAAKSRVEVCKEVCDDISAKYPDYTVLPAIDIDFSET